MVGRVVVVGLLLGGCSSADGEAGREAAAVCAAEASIKGLMRGAPDLRFREAFAAAERVAVSPDMQARTREYGRRDLAEHAAALRAAAAAAGVGACPLADKLDEVATAGPTRADARAMLEVLEAVAAASPEYVDELLAVGCSEIASCGRACVPGLASFREVAEGPARVQRLADGCAEFRPHAGEGPAAIGAFARARTAAFIAACGPQWTTAEAEQVAALRGRIGL